MGQVVAILTAPEKGAEMESHKAVEVTPGVGMLGDRYATQQGQWSDDRWPDQEVTLIEAEAVTSVGLVPEQMRRNIVTEGVDLNALIGVVFQLGEAELRGVRPCDPCSYIESRTRPGLVRDLAGRGGLRAAIIKG